MGFHFRLSRGLPGHSRVTGMRPGLCGLYHLWRLFNLIVIDAAGLSS